MMTPDHPNARWIAGLYEGSAAIANDETLDPAERLQRIAAHQGTIVERLSPDMAVHTGGYRLATTGDVAFFRNYAARRSTILDGPSTPVAVHLVLADDHFGIVHLRVRASVGGEVWEHEAMGAWRFEDGMVVEHWEIAPGPEWDQHYLGADPTLVDGDAHEYWSRPVG